MQRRPTPMRYAKSGLVVVLAAAAAAVAYALFGAGADRNEQLAATRATADETEPVIVQEIETARKLTRLEAVGTSRAIRSADIHPAVSGEVTAVGFSAGDFVEKDEMLVELDRRRERLAVSLAEVRLKDARRTLTRLERLSESGTTTDTQLDTARTAFEEARIALDQAEVALEDRVVRAPFSGHIGHTDIDPGSRIGPDTRIATLDDRSTLLVAFSVPEQFVGMLEPGMPVSLATWTDGAQRKTGHIADIGSRIAADSRTFTVRAGVDNDDDALRPGMSFRVTLDLAGPRYPVVPEVAVLWGREGSYIWAVQDGRAHRVAGEIIQRRQGEALVDADIPEGTRVVVEGVQRMREGIAVEIRQPGTPGDAPAISAVEARANES